MTGDTSDRREELAAPHLRQAEQLRPRRCQEPHEGLRGVESILGDLRVGGWIDAWGHRVAPNGFLSWQRRVRDSHLVPEGRGGEFAQRRNERLTAEATEPPVGGPVGTSGDPVPVGIVWIGQRQNRRLGHGVQQPQAKHSRRCPTRRRRRVRGHGRPVDPEGGMQRRGHAVLYHRPPLCAEVVAHSALVGRRVHL